MEERLLVDCEAEMWLVVVFGEDCPRLRWAGREGTGASGERRRSGGAVGPETAGLLEKKPLLPADGAFEGERKAALVLLLLLVGGEATETEEVEGKLVLKGRGEGRGPLMSPEVMDVLLPFLPAA
jgi:hypothetical protein